MKRRIGVNESGRRVGQGHHNAKLTDAEVDLVRELREDHGYTYGQIADWFGATAQTIKDICLYKRRAQTPHRYKPGA